MDLPKEKECIGLKWVYKAKFDVEGKTIKHNDRLVVKIFSQKYGIDYNEIFYLVDRPNIV